MQQIQGVYLSPKLWYLRVSIIEAQHIMPGHRGLEVVRFPEFSTKIQVGNQIWRTENAAPSATESFSNPYWNMEYLFVVTEPFEDHLLVSVEDQIEPGREEVVATMHLPVATIEKRTNEKPVTPRWFNLDSHFGSAGDDHKLITRFVSKIHMQISLDEGYDVLDEGTIHSSSDVRITDKRLWKPHVGVLEMRILAATELTPMKIKDGRGVTDAYCVAKYGREWVRTHTVVDSLSPKWNEQYIWEVYDPCSVLTIGVFDDCWINESTTKNTIALDNPMGKVRIRLSTIETDRAYTECYTLLMHDSTGVRKMGELQLALRFSCTNVANMLLNYTMPLLPSINYTHPLSVVEQDRLRDVALKVVALKLSVEEPPLSRDVVEYMHDLRDLHIRSMRRSKVNFQRLMGVRSSLVHMLSWLEAIPNWRNPVSSALFLIIFLTLVMLPESIIPTILLYMPFVWLWNYRFRVRHPPHMDTRLSQLDDVLPDELDEEFDTSPTKAIDGIDRLRSVAGMIQTVMGEVAIIGERLQVLLSWSDRRATILFMVLCLVAAVGFCVVPFRLVVALLVLYSLRPPRLRSKLPSLVDCFFWRLPPRFDIDSMLSASGGESRNPYYSHELTQDFLVACFLDSLQHEPTQDFVADL